MKRKLIDRRLWREGMRQLSLVGIMTFIVMELTAILVPVGYFISWQQTLNDPSNSFGIANLSGTVAQPLLFAMPYTAAPLMTLFLFRFLNKRSASDVYHQFPVRRECLYLSFFAAIAAWLTAIIVISAATGQLLFAVLLPARYALDAVGLWIYAFNMLAGSLLVAAGTSVAMSVTGNAFNNLVSAVCLLFVPRLVLLIFTELLINGLAVLPSDAVFPLFSVFYNIPAGLILGLFTGSSGKCSTDVGAGVYSLCLALAYVVLAAILFRRRKSEAAERASLNRGVQALLRVTVGFVVALVPCVLIAEEVLNGSGLDADTVFWIVTVYIIALVAMMIYELITTRRWKYLTRAFASFGIVLGLSALFVGGEALGQALIWSVEPTAEDIAYVRFSGDNLLFERRMDELTFDQPEVKELVAQGLSQAIADDRDDRGRLESYNYDRDVKIRTGLLTVSRRLRLTPAQAKQLDEALAANEAFLTQYTTLPPWEEVGLYIYDGELTAAEQRQVYESLCDELAALNDPAAWYRYVASEATESLTASELGVTVELLEAGRYYAYDLQIPREFTKTCDLLMQAITAGTREPLVEMLGDENYKINGLSLSSTGFWQDDEYKTIGRLVDTPLAAERRALIGLLSTDVKPSTAGSVVKMELEVSADRADYDYYHSNLVLYVPVNESNAAFLDALRVETDVHADITTMTDKISYSDWRKQGDFRWDVEITDPQDRRAIAALFTHAKTFEWWPEEEPLAVEEMYLQFEGEGGERSLYPVPGEDGYFHCGDDCGFLLITPSEWTELKTILARYDLEL